MRQACAGLFLVTLAALAACGGRSREAETGQSGAAGTSGTDACASGKQTYQEKRSEVLEPAAASGCSQDTDCASFYEDNACVARCDAPFPAKAIEAATVRLRQLANAECGSCPPILTPPCAPPGPLKCVEGRCTEGP